MAMVLVLMVAWRLLRHTTGPSPEVLAIVLTLFSALQAGQMERQDRSTLRGLLSAPGNWLIAASIVPALALAVVLAVMRLSPNPVFKTVSWVYLWIFRGTPVYVQLVFWGLFPTIYKNIQLGIPFGPALFHLDLQDLSIPFILASAWAAWVAVRTRLRRSAGNPGGLEELLPLTPLFALFVVYWAISISSHLNIGERHLMPVYPVLFILCGALGRWFTRPLGWRAIAAARARGAAMDTRSGSKGRLIAGP